MIFVDEFDYDEEAMKFIKLCGIETETLAHYYLNDYTHLSNIVYDYCNTRYKGRCSPDHHCFTVSEDHKELLQGMYMMMKTTSVSCISDKDLAIIVQLNLMTIKIIENLLVCFKANAHVYNCFKNIFK